jgi:hypothetical protein
MPDANILRFRQSDQARADFAIIEGDLEFLADQLARLPTGLIMPHAPLSMASALLAVVLLIR